MRFEFADSEIAQWTFMAGQIRLRFSAACVQLDSEQVWMPLWITVQPVTPWEPLALSEAAGRLHGGCWRTAAGVNQRVLPLPFHDGESGTLVLEFSNGVTVQMACHSLHVQAPDACHVVGAYQC